MSSLHRDVAVTLLARYLRVPYERSGAKWTDENHREVEDLVDCLLRAAADKAVDFIEEKARSKRPARSKRRT